PEERTSSHSVRSGPLAVGQVSDRLRERVTLYLSDDVGRARDGPLPLEEPNWFQPCRSCEDNRGETLVRAAQRYKLNRTASGETFLSRPEWERRGLHRSLGPQVARSLAKKLAQEPLPQCNRIG